MTKVLRAFSSFRQCLMAGAVLLPVAVVSFSPVASAQEAGARMSVPQQETSAPEAAPLSDSDRAWLAKIEQTLNSATTFQARMQQLDADGKRTTGVVWMKRPGQMRLAYDPPTPLVLVANEGKWSSGITSWTRPRLFPWNGLRWGCCSASISACLMM